MRGANASVVGILAAALYNPVWTGTVRDPVDIALAASSFALLALVRAPPVALVALGAVAGPLRVWLGF